MDDTALRPLSHVPAGARARVVALAGGRGFRGRLVRMGLSIGSEIEVIRGSNGRGGPTLVAAGELRLAIGRGMASKVLVEMKPGYQKQ